LKINTKRIWMEGWILRSGTLAYVGAFLIYGLAPSEWLFYSVRVLKGR